MLLKISHMNFSLIFACHQITAKGLFLREQQEEKNALESKNPLSPQKNT